MGRKSSFLDKRLQKYYKNSEINAFLLLNIRFLIKKVRFGDTISVFICIFANLKQITQ